MQDERQERHTFHSILEANLIVKDHLGDLDDVLQYLMRIEQVEDRKERLLIEQLEETLQRRSNS